MEYIFLQGNQPAVLVQQQCTAGGTSQVLCEKYDFHLGTAQLEKNTHQEQPAAEMVWETVGTTANDTVRLWKTQTGTSCKMEKSIPVLRLYRQFCGVKNEKICA